MPRVSVTDDVELFYQDLGDGPVVILIHGGCMSYRVWESQVCALLEEGFRVITPDLRGHGSSDKPVSPYTAEMYAADITAFADALGIDTFALVGWSLGATVVSTFASTFADRLNKLVLVSSSIFHSIAPESPGENRNSDLPIEKMLTNQRRNRPQGMERFVSGMFCSDVDEWMIQWLWSIGMQTPMRVAVKTLEIYISPESDTIRAAIANLDVPGAIFHGAQDRSATIAEAESIATKLLSDGKFVSFEESGHVPFIEESRKFNNELVKFLED